MSPPPTLLLRYRIREERIADWLAACEQNAAGTLTQADTVRFDLYQDEKDPCVFVLVEAYASEEAKAAHLASPHFKAWREATRDLHAEPPSLVKARAVFGVGL